MLELEVFKYNLQRVVNESGLSAGEVYYVLKDFFADVEKTYYKNVDDTIAEQQRQAQEQQKKAQEEQAKNAGEKNESAEPEAPVEEENKDADDHIED